MRSAPSFAVLTALLAVLPAAGQQVYKAPRLAGTNHPNLNGLWQSLTEANWDIQAHAAQPGPPQFGALYAQPAGPGIVEDNEIPYQPWAAARSQNSATLIAVKKMAAARIISP